MANKPEEFPIFSHVDNKTLVQMSEKMTRLLGNLSSFLGIDAKEITALKEVFIDVIERVEKRRVYFHIFHDGCKMGELNEGALLCFWIVKLHPFYHPKINANSLNAKIALCLFINAIYYHSIKTNTVHQMSGHFISDLYYSLVYRDISKEALMIIAESFTRER